MRMRLAVLALALIAATPSPPPADLRAFLGRNSADGDRALTRGFAFGVSLLVVGFEFEYANSSEALAEVRPSLRTPSGNVFVPTFGLPFQLYGTTGGGVYRERLGNDEETAALLNTGG